MLDFTEFPLAPEQNDREFMDVWIQDFGACALAAADTLGIFDALESKGLGASRLAGHLALDSNAVQATCRALVAMGALSCRGGQFSLTDSSRIFWTHESPCYRGREFDRHRYWEQYERIVNTLRAGWAPLLDDEQSFSEGWRQGTVTSESAENFTRVMHSMILTPSLAAVRSGAFDRVRHLVDVGGGSGVLAAMLRAHRPDCRVTVMDLPPVCEASRGILSEMQQGLDVQYFPANFFEDGWPHNADAFCLSNILHDWPLDNCAELLGHAFDALPPGGCLFVHEALLDEGGCSPRMTSVFNLLMYINHRGQQFTQAALFSLLETHGFCNPRVVSTYSYWSVVTAEKPQ